MSSVRLCAYSHESLRVIEGEGSMKKSGSPARARSSTTGVFVQRVTGKITPKQYVRAIDQRVSDRREDERQHRRSK
jgi:hypothetical protein